MLTTCGFVTLHSCDRGALNARHRVTSVATWLDYLQRLHRVCSTRCRRDVPAKGALTSWSWLQGFQALAADQGGFGGLAADVMGALRDEYARVPTLLFAVRPAAQGPADADGQVGPAATLKPV